MAHPIRWMLALALGALSSTALAGGDDYDPANDKDREGPVYFGFVRDANGAAVAGAAVTLTATNGKTATLNSNAVGLYRTHLNAETDPNTVTVSCAKDGYKQTKTQRRPSVAVAALVETTCILQRS
jgi:hypothetical protein